MSLYTKTLAGVLITLLLIPVLEKQGKDMALVLSAAACCIAALAVFTFLEPVLAFLLGLQAETNLEGETVKTLLKLVGIGLTGETAALLCADAGSSALGKGVQLLTSSLILSLSVPMLQRLIHLIRDILGGL